MPAAARADGASDGPGQEVLRKATQMRDALKDRGEEAASAVFQEVTQEREKGHNVYKYSIFDLLKKDRLLTLLRETAHPSEEATAAAQDVVDEWARSIKCDQRALHMLKQLQPERRFHVMATLRVTQKTRNASAALVGLCIAAQGRSGQQPRQRPQPQPPAEPVGPCPPGINALGLPGLGLGMGMGWPGSPMLAIPLVTEEGNVPSNLLPPLVEQVCHGRMDAGAHGYPAAGRWPYLDAFGVTGAGADVQPPQWYPAGAEQGMPGYWGAAGACGMPGPGGGLAAAAGVGPPVVTDSPNSPGSELPPCADASSPAEDSVRQTEHER
eukprot:TRINITY_DN27289_c0_g1_i1.p1 TRINITY_DN27289_c0_g1~~TRINITY_DN27289_c0_g1_i1.p1  ORF type:complete len:358 (+),score=117.38 TRINITY_DN27289_c0_g1_i1:101-1075(+)